MKKSILVKQCEYCRWYNKEIEENCYNCERKLRVVHRRTLIPLKDYLDQTAWRKHTIRLPSIFKDMIIRDWCLEVLL